jgi:pilus assembly protein Flp/PilA
MLQFLRHTASRDESGASAVEYGLLIAGVAALIVLIVFAFGGVVSGLFSDSCGTISNTVQGSTSCS